MRNELMRGAILLLQIVVFLTISFFGFSFVDEFVHLEPPILDMFAAGVVFAVSYLVVIFIGKQLRVRAGIYNPEQKKVSHTFIVIMLVLAPLIFVFGLLALAGVFH